MQCLIAGLFNYWHLKVLAPQQGTEVLVSEMREPVQSLAGLSRASPSLYREQTSSLITEPALARVNLTGIYYKRLTRRAGTMDAWRPNFSCHK